MVRVLFFRPVTFSGKLISWWTKSPWSHVAISLEHGGFEIECHADRGAGVVFWPKGRFRPADEVLELPWLSDDWAFDALLPRLGTKYGWRDILAFVIGKSRSNRKGVICTELVADLLLGYVATWPAPIPSEWAPMLEAIDSTSPEDLTPGELHAICAGYSPIELV